MATTKATYRCGHTGTISNHWEHGVAEGLKYCQTIDCPKCGQELEHQQQLERMRHLRDLIAFAHVNALEFEKFRHTRRQAGLAVLLLFASTTLSQAGVISPVGGSWSDGTTTAEYVEVDPLFGEDRRFQAVLTIGPDSHVISDVWLDGNRIYADDSLDFYDGAGDLAGEFAFDLELPAYLSVISYSPASAMHIYFDGAPGRELDATALQPAGQHVFGWQVSGAAININQRSYVTHLTVPEPAATWLVAGLVVIAAMSPRSRGWFSAGN